MPEEKTPTPSKHAGVKLEDHRNRVAAPAHEDVQPEPIDLPSPGITVDPKVDALIKSGKPLEVGGDNILREVKTDKS